MTTRIWLLSDLHVDASPWTPERIPSHDVCVVAGDVRDGLVRSLAWLTQHVVPRSPAVVYVPGNHDFWGHRLQSELARGQEAAAASGITLLAEGEAFEVAGIRLVGATLWTDYEIGPIPRAAAMAACGDRLGGMRDHRRIKERLPTGETNAFRPSAALREHVAQRGRIERILAEPFAGETVVVTHHAPHPASLRHGEWREATDAAYASDLSEILTGPHAPRLWLHGHVHRPIHHHVGRTEVVANPRGLVTTFRDRRGIERVETENPGFLPALVLEL